MYLHRLFYFYKVMEKLSGYVLTFNSEQYLAQLLSKMKTVCDELFVVDSGSSDGTEQIVRASGCHFVYHPFGNFSKQRNYALSLCNHRYVYFHDCDEIPSEDMLQYIKAQKRIGFIADKYRFKGLYNVLGQDIRGGIYPGSSMSYSDRIINKEKIHYTEHFMVHEEISAHDSRIDRPEYFHHYTFQTLEEFEEKLERYTSLSAQQMYAKGKRVSWIKRLFSPIAAWIKWYWMRKSFLDGLVGWECGKYAYKYTQKKYDKLMKKYEGVT